MSAAVDLLAYFQDFFHGRLNESCAFHQRNQQSLIDPFSKLSIDFFHKFFKMNTRMLTDMFRVSVSARTGGPRADRGRGLYNSTLQTAERRLARSRSQLELDTQHSDPTSRGPSPHKYNNGKRLQRNRLVNFRKTGPMTSLISIFFTSWS